jgi:hypothetical protein
MWPSLGACLFGLLEAKIFRFVIISLAFRAAFDELRDMCFWVFIFREEGFRILIFSF